MPKKKQQYIYVARDGNGKIRISFFPLISTGGNYFIHVGRNIANGYENMDLSGIKLKKGEQVKIPILVDKAEDVK